MGKEGRLFPDVIEQRLSDCLEGVIQDIQPVVVVVVVEIGSLAAWTTEMQNIASKNSNCYGWDFFFSGIGRDVAIVVVVVGV